MTRPAELTGLAGSVALIIAGLAGVKDPTALVAIGAVVGAIPAAVTLIVASGGIRGAVLRLWRGKPQQQGG